MVFRQGDPFLPPVPHPWPAREPSPPTSCLIYLHMILAPPSPFSSPPCLPKRPWQYRNTPEAPHQALRQHPRPPKGFTRRATSDIHMHITDALPSSYLCTLALICILFACRLYAALT
ncbi:hypothetical protein E2C01_069118 [Portunus trituberculatus]|uniref:Uncharacterized protein n=1 Tax=Portunus trituberculatus TaxID=210409 RepID=A0A5B7HXQ8_PORTR|nr:hypothetical protein [Portunus trituberculatus]